MNKLFLKVATLSVGLTMAIGVGVAVGSKGVREAKVEAAASYEFEGKTLQFSEQGLENSVQYLDPFTSEVFTVQFAGGGNDGKYYTTGTGMRTYGNGSFTITAVSGTLAKIDFQWHGDSYKPTSNVADSGSFNNSYTTWTGSASSVVFTRPSGSGHWRLQKITVTIDSGEKTLTTITINNTKPLALSVNDEPVQLDVTKDPSTISVSYSSSNTNVVTVSDSGLITVVGVGTSTVTASYPGDDTYAASDDSIVVNVEPAHITNMNVSQIVAATSSADPTVLYEFEGYVTAWKSGASDGTEYGNFYISDVKGDTANQAYVYGANHDNVPTWNGTKYTFSNKRTFLSDSLTSQIGIGTKVSVVFMAFMYQGTTFEFQGSIVDIINEEKTFESISLSGDYQTSFEVGDTFSHEGLVVTAHYSDSTTAVVTSSASVSSPDMSSTGDKTVTVSYTEGGNTDTEEYTINVHAASPKYIVTYTHGENGSGSYEHENNPAGSYTLLAFDALEGVSADEGYRFKSYTVGGVEKNPGESIEISGATAVTVNFEEKPEETTVSYIFKDHYSENTLLDDTAIVFDGAISATFAKGGTATQYYTNGEAVRWYGGGTLTIASSAGNIQSIELTFLSRHDNSVSADVGTYVDIESASGTGVWTGDAKTVVFTQSGTTGHDRISAISVTYAGSAPIVTTYTVEYNANGGEGEMTDSNSPYISGTLVTVLDNTFTREGYTFLEWNTAADGSGQSYDKDDTFNASANVVLYAQWKENGGTTVAARCYTLVEDASKLVAGAKYIITASAENGVALSTTQNNNNRGQEEVSIDGKTAAASTDKVQVITLEATETEGQWALNVGEGYLYASSSSANQLKTRAENSDGNGEWKFVFGEGGVATITAQGSNTRNVMQYNAGSKLFACYATASQSALYLYRLDFEATLLHNVTCDGAGSHTLPEGYSWSDLKAVYQDLPSEEQSALSTDSATAGSGLERYDYLVGKYGTAKYEDFLGRNPAPIASGRTFDFEIIASDNTSIIIIVIAAASALAFTMLLVFKKKKQK